MPFIKYGQPFYPHSNQSQTALSDEPIPDLLGASAWPEWLDSEMAAEKYTTKHAFEDPEHLSFPKSIRKLVAGLKRPVEMDDTQTPQVLVSTGIDDLFYASNAEQTHSKTSQANLTEDETVGWSRLQRANRHLHSSDLYRQTLAAWHCIVQMRKPDDVMPWDLVYPKGKDGQPVYNVSGKYIVKLFWAGTWRRVTVDDRIPLDQTGKPLVLMGAGPGLELWPMLVCKALVKLAAASSRDAQDETGDFDVMAALKGYMPERIGVSRAIEYVLDTMVGPATLTADSKSAHLILARPHSVLNESDIPPMWFRIMGYAPSDYDETPATLTMRALNSSGYFNLMIE